MPLIKRSDRPLPGNAGWLLDLLDTDRFLVSDFQGSQSFPLINIKETEASFDIEVASPGFTKDDFSISTERDVLTIAGEKDFGEEQKDENYVRRQFSCHSFTRSFTLPDNANGNSITANYADGILTLRIPKKSVDPVSIRKTIDVK